MTKHSPFEAIISKDIFTPGLLQAIDEGKIKADEATGKLYVTPGSMSPESPWIFHKTHEENLCGLWHHIMFDFYHYKMGMPPIGCQRCFKTVIRPRTLEELFKLLDIIERMNKPSKCGIERRYSVCGTYGGYFYSRCLDDGLKRYEQVRKQVDKFISKDVNVFLKRGCTEMEHAFGDSDKWQITPQSTHWEKLIVEAFDYKPFKPTQSEQMKNKVKRKWVEYAYANGDETYKIYTNGKPLYKPYVTYHDKPSKGGEK